MATLPPLALVSASPAALAAALSVLFEPSPVLLDTLVPALAAALPPDLPSFTALIDLATATIAAWPAPAQAALIGAHPRIGAPPAALSALSHQEQAAHATPPAVLARLADLNAQYEARFPGLRFVTFVDGRTRAAVADELAGVLAAAGDAPGIEAWRAELARAVRDVGRIALSRARALGAA